MRLAGLLFGLMLVMGVGDTVDAQEQVLLRLEPEKPVPYRVEADPQNWQLRVTFQTSVPVQMLAGEIDPVAAVSQIPDLDGWQVITMDMERGYDLVSSAYDGSQVLNITLRHVAGGAPVRKPTDSPTIVRQKPLIVLDPGHGGIDSGAVSGDIRESDLMLTFAQELSEALIRTDRFRVMQTRLDDKFLRLSQRIGIARDAGASVFISLHADALLEGNARGAAVFTLSEEASDAAAAELVRSHDRADVLMGGDLTGAEDDITAVLIEMAQRDTGPKSMLLAEMLVESLRGNERKLRKKPVQSANFGVLKSPDVPSVLIELGFMSDKEDLNNLLDDDWRNQAAIAIRDGLIDWLDAQEAAKFIRP